MFSCLLRIGTSCEASKGLGVTCALGISLAPPHRTTQHINPEFVWSPQQAFSIRECHISMPGCPRSVNKITGSHFSRFAATSAAANAPFWWFNFTCAVLPSSKNAHFWLLSFSCSPGDFLSPSHFPSFLSLSIGTDILYIGPVKGELHLQ